MRKFTETHKYTSGPCFKLGSPPFDKIASEQDPHIIHKGKDLFEDGEQELTEEYEEKQLNININDFIDVRDEDAGTVKSLINKDKHYNCVKCGKMFADRSNARKHVATHLPPRYRCRVCNLSFSDYSNIVRHMSTHRKTRTSEFECNTCHRVFNQYNVCTAPLIMKIQ